MSEVSLTSAFDLLPPEIRSALAARGIVEPTPAQEEAIPLILSGENVLLIAPTGYGKTEAAVLPLLARITRESSRGEGIKLLYISPLRALNRDLKDRIRWMAQSVGLSVAVRHGDTTQSERRRQAVQPPDVLVTTPETLQVLLVGRRLRAHMKAIRAVVIDEVHELVDDKRGVQLSAALERLKELVGRHFQVVALSATVGNPELVGKVFFDGEPFRIVDVTATKEMKLKVLYPEVTDEDVEVASSAATDPGVVSRLRTIVSIVSESESTLLFTNTRSAAEALGHRLSRWFPRLAVAVHHSSLSRDVRIEVEKALKSGELDTLVSTSSLELGIDVGHVDLVIQYMSPRQATRLVQRVGRSGHRVGEVSRGVIIASDPDEFLEALALCRRAKSGELEEPKVPQKPLDVALHQVVGMLLEYRSLPTRRALATLRRAYPFRTLSGEELLRTLRYIHSTWNRPLWLSDDGEIVSLPARRENTYRYYFENLSTIPDERRYPVVDEASGMLIGYLDEAFVLDHLYPGVKFVFKGAVWVFRRIEANRVIVSRADDPTGAIPSWVGEDLPVPMDVALEVGRIRRLVLEETRRSGVKAAARRVIEEYPFASIEDATRALAIIEDQVNSGVPTGTDRQIVLEGFSNYVVVHACAGTLVNRTLSRLLSHIIVESTGLGVLSNEDPYRVILRPASVEVVMQAIDRLKAEDLESLLLKVLPRTGRFAVRVLQVAKRMGLVSRWASVRELSLKKIVEAYEGTPVYEEAISESLLKDYDIQGLRTLLERLSSGEIELITVKGREPSPIAWLGLQRSQFYLEILPPERLEQILLRTAKARILSTDLVVVCPSCWSWWTTIRVSTLLESTQGLRCPACGSEALAAFSGKWAQRAIEAVEAARETGRPSVPDSELADRAFRLGLLTKRFGKTALVASAARGVDPEDLRDLLLKHSTVDDDFFRELVRRESEAIRRRLL
ncbi:MAG TPA: DEAD/DEAH box helicase [Candidatus Korarchaeota archaeon]|nr:DEAD/DEAH box helicase [Candidatus Korarchaeota archaeon]